MNQLKMGAILSYLSLIISMGIALVYTPVLVKNLGQEEYGVYSLMAAFVGYLTILDMGLGNAIVRYVARTRANDNRAQEAKLSGMFLILFSLLGVVVAVVGTIMYFQIETLFGNQLATGELAIAKIMAIILIANFAISFPISVFGAIIQAHERFIFLKFTGIIRSVITPLVTVPLLFLGYGSIMLVTITSIANIMFLLLNVVYCFKKLHIKIKFEKFDKALLKEIVIYSSFIFLNAIIDKIYWSTDQIILGAVSGANQVAIYAIAMQFIMIYMSISTAISGLFLPKVSIMEMKGATDKEFSDLFIRVGRIQTFMLVYILGGFIIAGEAFLTLWVGPEYKNSYLIVLVIMVPLSIILCQNVGIAILQAKNMHAFRSIIYIVIALVNIVISIPIGKNYGGIGISLITGVSLIIGHLFILNIYYYLKLKIDIFTFWKNSVISFILLILSIFITKEIIQFIQLKGIFEVLINGLVYSILIFIIFWMLFMNKYEKKLLLQFKSKQLGD